MPLEVVLLRRLPRLVVVPRAAPRLATSRRWQRCVPRAIETGAFSVSPPTGFSAPSSMAGPTVEKQGALVRLLLPRCRCDRASQVLRRRSAGELARRERSWATPCPGVRHPVHDPILQGGHCRLGQDHRVRGRSSQYAGSPWPREPAMPWTAACGLPIHFDQLAWNDVHLLKESLGHPGQVIYWPDCHTLIGG
jgi:hypothetical protein